MVDQTQMNGAPAAEGPPRAVARNTAEFMSDVLMLAELQGRLLVVDVESGIKRILPLAAIAMAGLVIGCSCVPIALAAVALALVEYAQFTPPQAFALALLGGALLSFALSATAFWKIRAGLGLLDRSQSEWKQNVEWLKSVLKQMNRSRAQHGALSEVRSRL